MPIIIRHNGALNNAMAGLAEGVSQGARLGLQMKELQQQDERYKESVRLANENLNLEKEQAARAQQEHDLRMKEYQDVEQGTRTLTQERLGTLRPQDAAGDYVRSGGLQEAGRAGALGPSVFAAGLQRHFDTVLQHARGVAEKLPPVMHERFWNDIQQGLARDANEALLSKTQSDWKGLLRDVSAPHGSEGVEDLVPEVQERAKGSLEAIQLASQMPPGPERDKAVAQAMQASRAQLQAQRLDVMQTRARRKRLAMITATYQSKLDRKRAGLYGGADGGDGVVDPDLVPFMEARLDAQEQVLEAAKLDPDMSTSEFMDRWERAGRTTIPVGRSTGSRSEGRIDAKDAHRMALDEWTALHPDEVDPTTQGKKVVPVDPMWLKSKMFEYMHPEAAAQYDQLRSGSDPMGGEGPPMGQPVGYGPQEVGVPAPDAPQTGAAGAQPQQQAQAKSFGELPTQARTQVVEALKAAAAAGKPQEILRIAAQSGVDIESIPRDVMDEIKKSVKEATGKKDAQKTNQRETLRGGGPF